MGNCIPAKTNIIMNMNIKLKNYEASPNNENDLKGDVKDKKQEGKKDEKEDKKNLSN